MRTVLVAVLCLLVHHTTLFAQPAVGPEILSNSLPIRNPLAPVPRPTFALAAPAVAIAMDRNGVAIAWTMPNASGANTIYASRLDSAGQIAGAVVELPRTSDNGTLTDATSPSMAASPTGSGFTVAWIEVSMSPGVVARSVYCHLDSDLNASAPRVLTSLPPDAAVIVRSGKSTWVSTNRTLWQIRTDGSIDRPITSGISAGDMVATGDYPLLVSSQRRKLSEAPSGCAPQPSCRVPTKWGCPAQCLIYPYWYDLHFGSPYTVSTTATFLFDSTAQPAIQSDGRDVFVAWLNGSQITGGTVKGSRLRTTSNENIPQELQAGQVLGNFGPDTGPTRPDIATDGERYVVVWRTTTPAGDHDISGASIDRSGTVSRFSIVTSSADERDPSVLATAPGTFLVTYEKFIGSERRIAGRFLRLNSRRRAAN